MRCIYCGTRTDTHLPLCVVKLQAENQKLALELITSHGENEALLWDIAKLNLQNQQLVDGIIATDFIQKQQAEIEHLKATCRHCANGGC